MSETEQGAAPPPSEPAAEPVTPEAPPPAEAEEESRKAKRFAQMTARLASTARERDELAQRLAYIEQTQRIAGQPSQEATTQAQIQQEAQRLAAAEAFEARKREFHRAGEELYPDWRDKCNNLMAMGADPQIASMLVEVEDGPKVAAALADDPEALEHIAGLRSERGRAVALGQFAAKIAARPARRVSQAPPPPKTVEARAAPKFDEQSATAQQLVDYYVRQGIERANARMKG